MNDFLLAILIYVGFFAFVAALTWLWDKTMP